MDQSKFIFVGISGGEKDRELFVQFNGFTFTKTCNKIEIDYWAKHFWNGIMGQLPIEGLLIEPKMKPSNTKLKPTTRVIGFYSESGKHATCSCTILKDGKIKDLELIEEGSRPIVNQSTMMYIAKNIIMKNYLEIEHD